MKPCPACTKEILESAANCPFCGHSPAPAADGVSAMIPYKNTNALIGYYLGVFSLIPCVGVLLAIPAVICGILGLGAAAKNPQAKGKVHAWVAIILGAIVLVGHAALVLMGFLADRR